MSKCRYDLSEDCNNTDCLNCVLDKIRDKIVRQCYEEFELGGFKDGYNSALVKVIDIIDKYKETEDKE